MPVGSLLVSLLSTEERPRGRKRCPSARAASHESLLGTNLSRSSLQGPTEETRGRRVYPYAQRSTFKLSTPIPTSSQRTPSSIRRVHPPEQLGRDMIGKYAEPPSPRHKVYVPPPPTGREGEEAPSGRRRCSSLTPEDHLATGSLFPHPPTPVKVVEMPCVPPKPRTTGRRFFSAIPGEITPKPRRGLKKVSPRRESREDAGDTPRRCVGRASYSAREKNKSHFTLAHCDDVQPASCRSRSAGMHRSASVDIISWRNAATQSSSLPPSPRSHRRGGTPARRSYNIINNLPL